MSHFSSHPSPRPDSDLGTGRAAAFRQERWERLCRLGARLFSVSISFVTLSPAGAPACPVGVGLAEAESSGALPLLAALGVDTLVVPDTLEEIRFKPTHRAAEAGSCRFFAAQPLRDPRGEVVGAFCLADRAARRTWEAADTRVLQDLAALAEQELTAARTGMSELQDQLQEARQVADRLLLNILPAAVAQRMRQETGIIADCYSQATLLVADLHDFSRLTSGLPPREVVDILNRIFSRFDEVVQRFGVEKIKTVGNAYVVAAGVPVPRPDHVPVMAEVALAMQQEMARLEAPGGQSFSLRIGLNTGPLMAGVIGTTKFSYDLWGETVATAWQMASYGVPGCIQVNDSIYELLRSSHLFEGRGEFYVQGRGEVRLYFLKGRRFRP